MAPRNYSKHKTFPIIPIVKLFKQDIIELLNNLEKIILDYCLPKSYIKNFHGCICFLGSHNCDITLILTRNNKPGVLAFQKSL